MANINGRKRHKIRRTLMLLTICFVFDQETIGKILNKAFTRNEYMAPKIYISTQNSVLLSKALYSYMENPEKPMKLFLKTSQLEHSMCLYSAPIRSGRHNEMGCFSQQEIRGQSRFHFCSENTKPRTQVRVIIFRSRGQNLVTGPYLWRHTGLFGHMFEKR